MLDVQARYNLLQRTSPLLRLYVLVDGVQYHAQSGGWLQPGDGLFPLFSGTCNATLAHAGPWLVNVENTDPLNIKELVQLDTGACGLVWLITPHQQDALALLLQYRMEARLPDGRRALLRFWDARVLGNLARTFDKTQYDEFFGSIPEWHFRHEGRHVQIGSAAAC